jgi:uncharacterized Zn finger protein
MKDDKISLTGEQVSKLADGSSFMRGSDYYESGNICNPVRQGRELRGECHGSREQPYKIRVILSPTLNSFHALRQLGEQLGGMVTGTLRGLGIGGEQEKYGSAD